ncbi:MAG: hypothetical protein JWO91_992 [Acidobacteriaceae bacterium]|nr:hypothetical protein [Acidobacteriaceae bacterium]
MQQGLEELMIVSARGVHDGQACRQAPTRIDLVGDRHIKQIDVVHHLRVLRFTLRLLRRANEMAE